MKEEKGPANDRESVPDKIRAADVVQFVKQNVFQLRAILLQADIR